MQPPVPIRPFLRLLAPLLFAPALGCGFSQQVNSSIGEQEQKLETEVARQAVQQADLIVAKVKDVLPTADTIVQIPVPGTQCTLAFSDKADEKTLTLSTPSCAIDPPEQGKDFQLQLTLVDLSFSARGTGVVALEGSGHLRLGAQLPLLGAYEGEATYTLSHSQVDTTRQTVDLHMVLSYTAGQNQVDMKIDVSGSRERIAGTVTGANLSCTLSGSLDKPSLACAPQK